MRNPPPPNPALVKYKAELAAMTPQARQQALALLAQLVKQHMQDSDHKRSGER